MYDRQNLITYQTDEVSIVFDIEQGSINPNDAVVVTSSDLAYSYDTAETSLANINTLDMLQIFKNAFSVPLGGIAGGVTIATIGYYLENYDDPWEQLAKDYAKEYSNIGKVISTISGLYDKLTGKKIPLKEYGSIISNASKIVNGIFGLIDNKDGEDGYYIKNAEYVATLCSSTMKILNSALKIMDTGSSSIFFPIVATLVGLEATFIKSIEDDWELDFSEWDSIQQDVTNVVTSFLTSFATGTGNESLNDSLKFGPTALFVDAISGVISGVLDFFNTKNEYMANGIPEEIAFKDALIGCIANAVHTTATKFVGGADDVIFGWITTILSKITGVEVSSENNYVEWTFSLFKTFNATNSGDSGGNYLLNAKDDAKVYGDSGNDQISNFASRAAIWGGNDDDTIFSHERIEGKEFSSNSLLGGVGDDWIISYSFWDTLYGGTGNDTIGVFNKSSKVYGEDGKDIIAVASSGNEIYGDADNDLVIIAMDTASLNKVYGGDGEDEIQVKSSTNTINGGASNDVIIIEGTAKNKVLGGEGNDSIRVNGSAIDNTILGDRGDDTISIDSAARVFVGYTKGDGNDTIVGFNEDDTLKVSIEYTTATVGNDVIVQVDSNTITLKDFAGKTLNTNSFQPYDFSALIASIIEPNHSGGNANIDTSVNVISGDNITNDSDNVILNAQGSSTIRNSGSHVEINGSTSNDSLNNGYYEMGNWSVGGNSVTISGGAGDDSILNDGSNVTIDGGSGDDFIVNDGSNVTIDGGSGDNFIVNFSGENVTLNGGVGNDTIVNHGSNVTINGCDSDDYIDNFDDSSNVTINGGVGNDTIVNHGSNVTINGCDSDDYIDNFGDSSNVTINGGVGNDTVNNYGEIVTIEGDSGDDFISSNKENVTISGGVGNDTIRGLGVILYYSGDGNDVIIDYSSKDTLIINGANYSTVISGDDVIIYVDDGSITLTETYEWGMPQIIFNEVPTNTSSNGSNMHSSLEPIQKFSDTYEYTGGDKVITDYSSDSKIQLTEPISNVEVVSDTFVVKSSTGDLVIENVVDKVIEFTNKDGNTTAYAYMAGDSKEVNGSALDKFEVLVGSAASSNNLIAGSGGSSLIGGGGDNTLQGGAGRDVFVYSSGNNLVNNYESGDIVKLATSYDSTDVKENNLVIKSTVGNLTIENVEEKIVDVTNTDGTLTQTYVARESGGEVAGNALGNSPEIFKIIVGAEDNKNHLIAGDGGSSLIGGKTDDILQGGIGHDAFSYSSGNDTITNYESLEEITFDGTYQNWITDGNDFVLNAAEGSLRITDAREKLIRVKNLDGSILMGVYMSDEEDVYDYSNYGEFITAIGSNNQRNTLIAGSAGSVLWGGDGKAWDEMYGGTGVNEFVYRYGNGADAIFNASYEDTVNLSDITFDQIVGTRLTPNRALFVFTDYGSLNILGQAGNFIIGGQSYNADYNNNQLQAK